MSNLTKTDAILAMEQGKKVRHEDFSPEEWMTMEGKQCNKKIVLEDGVKCSPIEFWKWRTDKSWDNGYSIIN